MWSLAVCVTRPEIRLLFAGHLECGPKRVTVGYLDGCFYSPGEFVSLQCLEFLRRTNKTYIDYIENESGHCSDLSCLDYLYKSQKP